MTTEEFSAKIEAIIKKGDKVSSRFEKNLVALAMYSVSLAKKIAEIDGNKKFNVYTGKDPLDINIIATDGSKYMYEKPIKDVQNQLESFEKAYARYGSLFIYGLGNGVLLKGILQNQTHKTIVVFEPEIEIIYIVFHFFDFSAELFKQRLIIFQSDVMVFSHYYAIVQMKDVLNSARLYNLYTTSSFYDSYIDDKKNINDNFAKAFMQSMREIGNDSTDALIGIKNTTSRISEMLEGIPLSSITKERKSKIKTAIIVSAGPSLNKQIELLKQAQNHATIISVDASYPILKKHGITPDYVTTIERVEATSKFFEDKPSEFDKNIIFVAAALTHNKTAEYLQGRNTSYVLRVINYEIGFEEYDFGYIGGGQSTAHMAFELAIRLEHNKVIFVGQDLAYGEGRSTHAKGHVHSGEKDKKRATEYAEGYGGNGVVETTLVWNQFRQYFENVIAIAKKKNKIIYNCTEGGARIHGAIEKPFKEVLEEEVFAEEKPNMPLPKKLTDRQKAAKYKKFSKHIKSVLRYGKSLQNKCEKLFLKLAKQIERGKKLKEQGKENKINYEKLQKLSFEIDAFKNSLNDPRFMGSYYSITCSFMQNQDLEFAAIIAKPSDTLEEKREKLFLWVSVQGHWLFTIAGMISVMRENIEKSSASWLK